MEILLTNHHLNLLGGSETFTYSLAHALRKGGHSVSILTAEPGAVSEILVKDGFVVTTKPSDLAESSFDVIHCHHNTMALVARAVFPDTPMVFLSHGIVPGLEEPPSIDLGIGGFISVSEEVQNNLINNYQIDGPRVIRNGVDCERFKAKKPINDSLKNILILSNHFPDEQFSAVKNAASVIGAQTRLVGLSTGSVWTTEEEINNADLVVSLGRGVLEAMACERAALVFDWYGGDGILTAETYPEVRKHNFSGRRFALKYDQESLVNELNKYNPAMGKANRDLVLKYHNIDQHVSMYEKVYQQAVDGWRSSPIKTSPGREILFYQNSWRERSQILQQAIQLNNENITLKEEIRSEKARFEEEKKSLGISSGASSKAGARDLKRSTGLPELINYTGKNLAFIFGPLRSGTTWVLSLFREHPDVVIADVDNLNVRRRDAKTMETGIFLEDRGLKDENIRERFYLLSQSNPGKIIIEKTPIHVFMVSRISLIFPDAAFILLKRDGRDVATSMINVAGKKDSWWKGAPSTVIDAVDYWRKFAEAGEECERLFSPYDIKYEDLRRNTIAELACMTKAMGLSLDYLAEQVEAARGGKNIPIKGVFRKGTTGDWRSLFNESDVEAFKSKAGEMLISLGYEKDNNWTLKSKVLSSNFTAGNRILSYMGPKHKGINYAQGMGHSGALTSIIILTHNQVNYTRKCIRSLMDYTEGPFELIVVDNGSTDGTVEYLESEVGDQRVEIGGKRSEVKIIKNRENLGFSAGNNQGIAVARGKYILLMNNDIVVTPGWLTHLIACAEQDRKIGIVGPMSNYVSGPQLVKDVTYNTENLDGLNDFAAEFSNKHSGKAAPFWRVVGFCMLIKRAVIDKIGGLDARYGLGNFEDDDFSLRATLAGYESRIAEDCFVHHFGNRTFIAARIDYKKSLHNNWEIFKEKWGIPKNVPYGSSYDLSFLLKDGFIHSKHYFSIGETPDLQFSKEKTILSSSKQEEEYLEIQQSIATGKKQEAKEALEKLLLGDPEFALAHNDLGVLYFQAGDKAKALKHYERAVALQPVNVTFLKNLADFYYVELGRVEDAMKLYVKILYLNPKDKETLLIMGHICVSLKKFDDAKEFYNRVLENDPLNADARQVLDKLLDHKHAVNPDIQVSIVISTSGPQKYIKECVESVKKHTPEAHEIIFVDNGAGKRTTKWLKQYMRENADCNLVKCQRNASLASIYNEGIKTSTGECIALLSNDVVVSEKWLSGMLECMKSVPDAGIVGPMSNISRGGQKASTGDDISIDQFDKFADAFMAKNRYRRIPSNSIDGFCMLFARDLVEEIGFFDEQFGKNGYEDEDFCLRAVMEGHINLIAGDVYVHRQNKKAVARNRKYFNEKWNKADSHTLSGKKFLTLTAIERGVQAYQRGNIDDAVELFLEGIRLSPDDTHAYYALAEMLLHAKNYKDAVDILNEIPQDEQDNRRIELLGYCKEGMDLDQEALDHADRALSINSHSAAALNLKGVLAYKQGEVRFAEDYFKKAMEADPGYGEPYTNLGAMLWGDKPDDALDLFERGFILSPVIPDIVTNYHSAITASEEFERAGQVFEEAGLLCPNSKMIKYQLIDMLIKQGKNRAAMHQIEEAIVLFGADDGILPAALRIRGLLGPKEINKETNKKSTVSLCMIVKNEEKYLAKCLKSIKPVVDEMIIVDTGSTDRTKDIATVFGAKVYDFEWTGDFSEARNFSISKASGSWLFHLDADEVISPVDYEGFRNLIRHSTSKNAVFSFNTRNYTMHVFQAQWTANDGKYAFEEAADGWTPSEKVRLFPKDSRIRFQFPIHEMVEPSLKKAGIALRKCDIAVHHYGRLNREKSLKKEDVYYEIGKKKLHEMGDDPIALRELAVQAEILGKHAESVELWEKFIAIEPNEPKAYINMGIAYTGLRQFEDVLETAQMAMKLAPDMREAHYHYALGKLHLGRATEAVSSLEELLERESDYPPAQFLLAAAYCCAEEKDKGVNVLKELQKTSMAQSLPDRFCGLAKEFISSKKPKYTQLLLEAAIEIKISNKDMLELYSRCLEITNDQNKMRTNQTIACDSLRRADMKSDVEKVMPDLDLLKQAKELGQKGQIDDAVELTLKAIGRFPDDKRSYFFLAQTLINEKKFKDALDVLNEMPPGNQGAEKLTLLGYCKEGMKQYDDAKEYATEALSLNPSSAPALNLMGILSYNQGDHGKAETFFNQAIESEPEYGEAYTNLGAIRWEKNRDEALGLFEKAFNLSPVISDVVANYHSAASALGAFERAGQVFEDIISRCPQNKLIKYRLIDLLIKQEKYAQAMEQIEDAIALFGVDDGILSSALAVRDLLGLKEIEPSENKKDSVSLCMIVKNEEKHLAKCLKSVQPVVDEMIIVDTGSTDRTKDIARVFGAKVFDFTWNDNFSEARNFSISKAKGRWILILDADEIISSIDYEPFRKLIKRATANPVGCVFTTRNYTTDLNQLNWTANDERYVGEASGNGWTPSSKVRLFPNESRIRFEAPIHELVEPSLKRAGIKEMKCSIPVHHYGNLDRKKSGLKDELYYQIGRKKLNDIGDDPVALRELAMQAQHTKKYEESIELWERFIAIEPNAPAAFVSLGAAYSKLGKWKSAFESAEEALKLDPEMKEGIYTLALSKLHLGCAEEAVSMLEKPMKRIGEYPPTKFLMAAAYFCNGEKEKGGNALKTIGNTPISQSLPARCYALAKELISSRRSDYARLVLEASIDNKISNKDILNLYADCLGLANGNKKAGEIKCPLMAI